MGDLASALAAALNLPPQAGPESYAALGEQPAAAPSLKLSRPAPPRETTAADIPQRHLEAAERIAMQLARSTSLRSNRFWRQRIGWGLAFGRTCMDCGGRMIFASPDAVPNQIWPLLATIDHVQQQAYGGSHAAENLQVICASCNNARAIQRPGRPPFQARAGTRSEEIRRERAALHAYAYLWPHLSWALQEAEDLD